MLQPMPRPHHSSLQPLNTRTEYSAAEPRRKSYSQGPGKRSTASFPSPSIVSARAFYSTPIGPDLRAYERRRSLIEAHLIPRQHSVFPGNLASQLESFKFGASKGSPKPLPQVDDSAPRIKVEKQEDMVMAEVRAVIPAASNVSQSPKTSNSQSETPQDVLRQVPFEYTHEHLRDWGYAYLGSAKTADAMVNEVSLKRPSLSLAQEDEFQVKSSYLVTIRARVLPKSKERKPFIINRQFDIDELRASIPKPHTHEQPDNDTLPEIARNLGRSSRPRRSSVQMSENSKNRCATEFRPAERLSHFGRGGIPIRK